MKSIRIYFVASSIALALIAMSVPTSTISQSTTGAGSYPPEFSPLRTSHPRRAQRTLTPQGKFLRVRNSIPNKYIVVLNDDVVSNEASLATRRAKVRSIADTLAKVHTGKIRFVYETALKGFSIELPDEAQAIALSQNPKVKFVEQNSVGTVVTTQPNPPSWGLDRIDQMDLPLNSQYVYNANGSGVTAYIIDTGIRSTHVDFGGRASVAADFISEPNCSGVNNDCHSVGHGTHVAGTVGGDSFGVAKGVTIRSLKVCDAEGNCDADVVAEAVDWVTTDHMNSSNLAVVNISLLYFQRILSLDMAVVNSTNAGVTYAVAAGNEIDLDAGDFSPAGVTEALTVGSSNINDGKSGFSNIGETLDLFAPGSSIVSASNLSNNGSRTLSGTSMASPHTAGAVSLYLQGRTGITNCSANPIQGPASTSGGAISTCPDRVVRFIDSNAGLSKLSDVPAGTPNRLLFTGSLPTTTNPVDNQRFFVWQHYADFLTGQPEPDEGGLNFWTGNITATCGSGVNDNNGCTHTKRIDVSRAFWVAAFPSLFTGSGDQLTDNAQFVHECYVVYLRRSVSAGDAGFQFWLNDLNSYGNPANQNGINHLIDAFLSSGDYRQRFGQP